MKDSGRHGRFQRDASEPEIIQALQAQGCEVVMLHGPLDLVVAFETAAGHWRMIFVEVKNPKGPKGGSAASALNDQQQGFFARWPADLRFIVRTPEDSTLLIARLKLGLDGDLWSDPRTA